MVNAEKCRDMIYITCIMFGRLWHEHSREHLVHLADNTLINRDSIEIRFNQGMDSSEIIHTEQNLTATPITQLSKQIFFYSMTSAQIRQLGSRQSTLLSLYLLLKVSILARERLH